MAVTANYETVMVVSLKNGEENVQKVVEKFKARESLLTLSTRRAKATKFSSILKAQQSSLQSSTVSTRLQTV